MPTATIMIHGCIQDYQEVDLPEDQMTSRVIFDVVVGDQVYKDCHVELSQPVGTDYASAPIELGPPQGYSGQTWSHNAFSDEVENYYRTRICGPGAGGISIAGDSNIRMRDNMIMSSYTFELELPD